MCQTFKILILELQTSAFSIFFGTILLAVFLPASIKDVSHAPGIQLFYLTILGIFSSAIAYASWSKAFAQAKQTSQVSNYMFITPFLTSILGFIIADEIPEPPTLAGRAAPITLKFFRMGIDIISYPVCRVFEHIRKKAAA